jgi:hypothetical protein
LSPLVAQAGRFPLGLAGLRVGGVGRTCSHPPMQAHLRGLRRPLRVSRWVAGNGEDWPPMGRMVRTKHLVLPRPQEGGRVSDEAIGTNTWVSRHSVEDTRVLSSATGDLACGRADLQYSCARLGRRFNLTIDSKNQHSESQEPEFIDPLEKPC